jgi:hypothetical protein
VKIVYYDHARGREQKGFRSGEAGHGTIDASGSLCSEPRVVIGPNAYHALVGHEVVVQLNELPLDGGPVGSRQEAWVRPSASEAAAQIFYEADRKTYGGSWEFVVGRQDIPEAVEYRIRIDNRAYQSSLSQLQFLATTASRHGWAISLTI